MKNPPAPTARKRGKRIELQSWLARREPRPIDEADFEELLHSLAPISESYLRRLLRDGGVELAPMVEGVRQDDFDRLERTLLALAGEYLNGDEARRAAARRVVITAKDHARWAARRDPRRADKPEMTLWMLTWLENPPVFGDWVKLRRARLSG